MKPEGDQNAMSVRILDKEFRIACPPEERDALWSSARLLNDRMREMRDSGRVIGIDRIAVMAGLNIAHELLQQKSAREEFQSSSLPRLGALQERMERLLARHKNGRIDF